MNEIKLDILAFGAHADDVEIGMSGTIAKYVEKGYKVGICDLTEAELSSNGNPTLRKTEAIAAGRILNVSVREGLHLGDRQLFLTSERIKQVVEMIRKYQPTIVFAPYEIDRHPDHANATKIVEEAVFSAGIRKYQTSEYQTDHKVKSFYYYMINGFHQPDFMIDITSTIDKKIASLNAYQSQFTKTEGAVDTPLTNGYVEMVEARERLFGQQVGVKYAEGFMVKKPLMIENDLFGV
ncbi:bacillithiol biosynthesis deacetylase BshB1 [Cytobacillus kochii]|uniref:bacillithiol biosynthesis deacetylase BshB1 n=1 Tax=Cytobacillus kochii TaxID=859143 RepID=UPI00402A6469